MAEWPFDNIKITAAVPAASIKFLYVIPEANDCIFIAVSVSFSRPHTYLMAW